MSLKNPLLSIKYILQTGWSIWITIVLVFNILDLYSKSGNFDLLNRITSVYQVPELINILLFTGIIIWQIIIAIFFWRGVLNKEGIPNSTILTGYAASLSLWLIFMIADEFFRSYQIEEVHMRVFIAQLLSLILIIYTPAARR